MLCGCMSHDHDHVQHGQKYPCVAINSTRLHYNSHCASSCMTACPTQHLKGTFSRRNLIAFKLLNLQMPEKQASTCMPLNKLLECLQNIIIIILLTMEFPLNGTIGAKTPGKASSNTKLYR